MFFNDFHLAVGRGLFVIAYGDDSSAHVASILDAAKAHAPGATAELPAPWRGLQRFAPPGTNGISELDMPLAIQHIGMFLQALRQAMPAQVLPDWTLGDTTWTEQVGPLLREYHLDKLRTFTGFAANTWRFAMLW
jgi:hypothetical protein